MSDKKSSADPETILITLDQIGQTIDIMTDVVGKLRVYLTEQIEEPFEDQPEGDFEREVERLIHEESQTLH